jgi:hypothetical protein
LRAVEVTVASSVIFVAAPTEIVFDVVVGLADAEVPAAVRLKETAATVTELPATAVTLPLVIALAMLAPPNPPVRAPDGRPLGNPLGRLAPGVKLAPPNPPPPKPPTPPRVHEPFTGCDTAIVVGESLPVAAGLAEADVPAAVASIATTHDPTLMSARVAVIVWLILVDEV